VTLHPERLLITALVLAPNLVYLAYPPRDVDTWGPATEPRALAVLEKAGQVLSFTLPVFFSVTFTGPIAVAAWGLMAGCLAFYYAGWVRYLTGGRSFALLYRPLVGVPIPMALAPVLYFGASALVLGSWPQALAAVALALGHGGISWSEAKRTARGPG